MFGCRAAAAVAKRPRQTADKSVTTFLGIMGVGGKGESRQVHPQTGSLLQGPNCKQIWTGRVQSPRYKIPILLARAGKSPAHDRAEPTRDAVRWDAGDASGAWRWRTQSRLPPPR